MLLSTEPANKREVRIALAFVLVSAALFIVAAPFARHPLPPSPSFIPSYESALIICDLVTAVLLFGQYKVSRLRSLFALASGFVFTAVVAFSHALSFPGAFWPTGLLGGVQTTIWLYVIWHGGFPLFVIFYAVLRENDGGQAAPEAGRLHRDGVAVAILADVVAVIAIVCGLTFIVVAKQDSVPALIKEGGFTQAFTVVVLLLMFLAAVPLILLWRRRSLRVLDLWLMVVMCVWFFEIGLSALFNHSRFDLGWYVGRVYGLMAASSLLIVLLIESGNYYERLARLSGELGAANKFLEQQTRQDGMTNLSNRRFFDIYLVNQTSLARRHKRPLALVLCDVDSFKAYNDHYGHPAGDECLRAVAGALQSCCKRPADIVARYGGEEFALILPETELSGALQLAEAARRAVERLRIPHEHSLGAPVVSISGGVAVLSGQFRESAEELIARADQALFRAKHLGRNRIVSDVPEERQILA
jgi:diguanylate cyclase (GGDEF)-like protein